jgi:hypothetical protein
VNTIHTNLIGARALINLQGDAERGAYHQGTIAAIYLDSTSLPRFLVVLDPEPPPDLQTAGPEGGQLVEVVASRIMRVALPVMLPPLPQGY